MKPDTDVGTKPTRVRCPVCGFDLPSPLPGNCPRPGCGVAIDPGPPIRARTFRLLDHYSLFVLPFSFAEREGLDLPRALTDAGRWKQRLFSANDPEDVDRTEYFLPYIRRFLFPSLYPPVKGMPQGEETCRHFAFDLARLGPLDKEGLPLTMHWRDVRKKMSMQHRLLVEKIELIVFSYRVGFLVLRVSCPEPGATWFDQMGITAVLRALEPLYRDFEMPVLECGPARCTVPSLLAFLLSEFSGSPPPADLQTMPAEAPLPVKPGYDDRMMVYTFSCLDRNSALADADRCQALLDKETVIGFDQEWSKLPATQKADPDPDAWMRKRWQGFSKDGGSLVVFDTDAYHARYVGVYPGTYYFDVFLLAAMQRVTRLTLFERLADIQTLTKGGSAGRRILRRTRRDLLLFKNQCCFSQISNRERGMVLWKKWQKTLETRRLLKEVNEQATELDSYLQGRHREQMERLVQVGGFLVAALPTVWGIDKFLGHTEWTSTVRWSLLGLLVAGAAGVVWYVFFRQEDA
jgi:hypothetical protein